MSKKKKVKSVGLIVEDNSDYIAFKHIIKRISEKENLTLKKAIGNGCGKLRRKALSYCQNLHQKGCDLIILVHDLDRNELSKLEKELEDLIAPSPAKYNFICIPIEEIEGWFLSDPEGLKSAFNLDRKPSVNGNPETISSPKEKLEEIVYLCSNKSKMYLNTQHNELLAINICLNKMKEKCSSFLKLYNEMKLYDFK